MIDRGKIGHETAPTRVRVDGWRVALFCRAIGETDPVYVDAGAARAAGHPACPVPPTFLKAVESEHLDGIALLKLLDAPLGRTLHGGQAFEHLAPVYVGDEVEVGRRVVDIQDRKGGALTVIDVDTFFRVRGEPVATCRQTIVVRNAVAAT